MKTRWLQTLLHSLLQTFGWYCNENTKYVAK
uniref:Uncharacterized protein n=1 Tax=Siphoviridae sp. ctrEg9 TaxID=2825688 RepID=A0A8S5PGK0_9CAUD|nr:MAG TPA: hypothetical protein [Siphoviridae sp. ctrEg9]